MSFSYYYLTRRVWFLNYRDYMCMGLITGYGLEKFVEYCNAEDDRNVTMRVYTDDESDTRFKSVYNKTDGAVAREKAMAYAEKIKLLRAQHEREAQLDAFNYLYKTNLQV